MIRGSSLATMLMPCLQNALQVVKNDSPDADQFQGSALRHVILFHSPSSPESVLS
jgi:hypothetical protein